MPVYTNFGKFEEYVKKANPGFRLSASSLRALIEELKSDKGTPQKVKEKLVGLSADKAAKYRDAIWYLQATYPGLDPIIINIGELGKTKAAKYSKTPVLGYYKTQDPNKFTEFKRHKPVSNWLVPNQCVEQWLIMEKETPNKGILTIHLSKCVDEMSMMFEGRSVVDHMNSVLRIGLETNCDLFCLYVGDPPPICDELKNSAEAYGNRKKVLGIKQGQHMGSVDQNYINFASTHPTVVVMGFDANVCVNANLFGAPEKTITGGVALPLTSLTNVVTSRAILATSGVIHPSDGGMEYGKLYDT